MAKEINFSTFTDIELSDLIYKAKEERDKRKAEKAEKREALIKAFKKVWADLEKEGIEIWFTGNEYTVEEDFQLKLNEVYFDSEP